MAEVALFLNKHDVQTQSCLLTRLDDSAVYFLQAISAVPVWYVSCNKNSPKAQIMFDEIVNMVKHQLGNNPQVASSLPAGQEDAIHNEVATQITHGLANQSVQQGGVGGMLSQLQNAATSGSPVVNAIEGGVVGALASKFGLPPAVTGAIAASLPGLLQKFAHKANDPNDQSITPGGLGDMFSKITGGGLGSLFNR